MYTGYFAQLKKYEAQGLVPISICGKAPAWYSGLQYKNLAPKWSFFNEWKNGPEHKGDNNYYIEHFNTEVLQNYTPKDIVESLVALSNVDESKIILICYEKPTDFCHRHLVADWLSSGGYACEEYVIC